MKYMQFIFMALMSTLLCACGFQLRGSYHLPPSLTAVYLQSPTPYSPLMNQLRQSLQASQVKVVNNPFAAPYTLSVQGENFNTVQTSIGGSETMRQYTATYSVSYVLQDAKGKAVFGPRAASTTSTLNLMPNEELTSSSKLNDTKASMLQEVVSQLLFQLSSKNAINAIR